MQGTIVMPKTGVRPYQFSEASTASGADDSSFNAACVVDSSGSDNTTVTPFATVPRQGPYGHSVPEGIPDLSGEPMKVIIGSYMGQQPPPVSHCTSQGNIQLPNRAGPEAMHALSQRLQLQHHTEASLQDLQLDVTKTWQHQQGQAPVESSNPEAPQDFAAMPLLRGLPQLLQKGPPPGIFLKPQELPRENQALAQRLAAQFSVNANTVIASSVPDFVQPHQHYGGGIAPAVKSKGGQGKGRNSVGFEAKDVDRSKKNASKDCGGVPSGACKNATRTPVEHNNPQQGPVSFDHHRTIVALNINRLGYDAEEELRKHFSKFGKIDSIHMPRKIERVQPTSKSNRYTHRRPSCLGFLVMSAEAEAQAILALGTEQVVRGKLITIRCFKKPGAAEDENETKQCLEARE